MERRAGVASTAARDVRHTLPGLLALAMSVALTLDLITLKLVGFDLAAYILAARRVAVGEALYQTSITALGPFGQYLYPPFVVVPFMPIAMLPFDVARGAGLILLSALAVVVIWVVVSPLAPSKRYWAAAGLVLFFPLIWEVTLENLTLVALACCLVAWRLRRSTARSGAAFAAALGLKLLPLSLIVYFVAAGRVRVVLWSAIGLLAVTVLSWPVVGREWPAFVALLVYLAQAPAGTGSNIVPVLFAAPALRPVLPGLACVIAVLCGIASRARDAREEHAFRVALAAVPLVASTLWYPYLIFALPLLAASGPRPPRSLLRPVFTAARPVAWLLMQWETLRDPGREFVMPLVGLLLLLAVGMLELSWYEHTALARAQARSTTAIRSEAIA